jgi:radical SAM protein with 4Fe4S-binding SPASM domain
LSAFTAFQQRRRQSLAFPIIRRALELFGSSFRKNAYLSFYGGEPLLEFATIRRTVEWIDHCRDLKAKSLRYSISTNGTLLNEERLRFLSAHRFKVNLSHDGAAQDVTRPSRLNPFLLEIIDRLKRLPGIEFETNSVFIPGTVGEVYRSARFFIDRGIKNCHLTYSILNPWDSVHLDRMRDEARELRAFLLSHYRRHREIPVQNFQGPPGAGLFRCAAGQDRMALAADGRLWGCRFFADYYGGHENRPGFHSYCFGDIQSFSLNEDDAYPAVCENYRALRMDRFASERKTCRRCPSMLFCSACPATAALSTGVIGKIPAWMCDLKNIWLQEVRKFWAEAGKS